jgi:hypothetical protein
VRYILRKFTFGFTAGMLALSACAAKIDHATPTTTTVDAQTRCAYAVWGIDGMTFGDAIEFCNG